MYSFWVLQLCSFVKRRENVGCLYGSSVQGTGAAYEKVWQDCICRHRYSLPWRAVTWELG